ncbi:MAG: M24 family metallopeptidase [Alkalilacustris sp.]
MTKGVGGATAEAELARMTSWRDAVQPITTAEREGRIERAQARMAEIGTAALWLDASTNLEYFTGVRHKLTERMIGAILPVRGEPVYLSPAFEAEKLSTMLTIGDRIVGWEENESPHTLFVQTLRDLQISSGTLAIDENAPFFTVHGIAQAAGSDYALVPSTDVAGWCRARKSPAELALITHAMKATLHIQAAAARILHEGITTTEVQEFVAAAHRRLGFDPGTGGGVALFGEATAYPHGVPYPQTLRDGDMVLIDCGGPMHGYVSDITRSYVFGTPTPRQREIWELQRASQDASFAAIRPGVPCGAVDDAGRAVIAAAGLGPDYAVPGVPHRIGHGVGMDVHEGPYFVRGNTLPMAEGMTGSIEPTICLYGEFGVRVEDHFFVTADGAAWHTTPSPCLDDPFAGVA